MTLRSECRAKRPLAPDRAPSPLAALGVSILASVSVSGLTPALADAPAGGHQGKIVSMQTVHTGRLISYDITVTSPDEFPMRDEIVTLSVGGETFSNSHYIPGTDLNTLVFSLTQQQFQSLPTGTAAVVYYGQDDAGILKAQWVLGTSDKGILDIPQLGSPIAVSPVRVGPILAAPGALVSRVKTGQGSASNTHAASGHVVAQQKGKK